jgi:hypothetical protein
LREPQDVEMGEIVLKMVWIGRAGAGLLGLSRGSRSARAEKKMDWRVQEAEVVHDREISERAEKARVGVDLLGELMELASAVARSPGSPVPVDVLGILSPLDMVTRDG